MGPLTWRGKVGGKTVPATRWVSEDMAGKGVQSVVARVAALLKVCAHTHTHTQTDKRTCTHTHTHAPAYTHTHGDAYIHAHT